MYGFYESGKVIKSVVPATKTKQIKEAINTMSTVKIPIRKLAEAIATCEGWETEGSMARRNNNPGNVRRNHQFVKYKTVEDGWKDQEKVIQGYINAGSTLYGMMHYYSPPSENNTLEHIDCISDHGNIPKYVQLKNFII